MSKPLPNQGAALESELRMVALALIVEGGSPAQQVADEKEKQPDQTKNGIFSPIRKV